MKRTRFIAFATGWMLIFLSLPLPAAYNELYGQGATWRFWCRKVFWEPPAIIGLGGAVNMGAGFEAIPLLIASLILLWSIPAMVLSIRLNRPVGPRFLPLFLLLIWTGWLMGYERRSLSSGYYLLAAGFTVITSALLLPDIGRDTPERRGFSVPPLSPSSTLQSSLDEELRKFRT